MKTVRIGSRESRLAVIQSEMVQEYLREQGICAKILTMKTTGDIILDRTLDQIGGKGLFVKELDRALLEGKSDLSVHSLKDLPMEVSAELPVVAYSRREDPRDVLILPKGVKELDPDKPIGSSSLRRCLQLEKLFPGIKCKSVRGNVLTRLRKLDNGEYSALVLAAAGVKRLGLEERISRYFTVEEMLPAAGQGILAVQGRAGEDYSYLKEFHNIKAGTEAQAERAFVRWLDGGCSSPVAAHAVCREGKIQMTGLYYHEATGQWHKDQIAGDAQEAEILGITLAKKMKGRYE